MLGAIALLGIDWNIVGALATVLSLAVLMGTLVASRVKKWRSELSEEENIDQRIITTLFGKDAVPPYPAIDGLIKEHGKLDNNVQELHDRVTAVEDKLETINGHVKTLIERTQENGGSSIKDQLNVITEYIMAQKLLNQEDDNEFHG